MQKLAETKILPLKIRQALSQRCMTLHNGRSTQIPEQNFVSFMRRIVQIASNSNVLYVDTSSLDEKRLLCA